MSMDSRGTRFYGLFRFQIVQKTKKIKKNFKNFPKIFPDFRNFPRWGVVIFFKNPKFEKQKSTVESLIFGLMWCFLAYLGPKQPSQGGNTLIRGVEHSFSGKCGVKKGGILSLSFWTPKIGTLFSKNPPSKFNFLAQKRVFWAIWNLNGGGVKPVFFAVIQM